MATTVAALGSQIAAGSTNAPPSIDRYRIIGERISSKPKSQTVLPADAAMAVEPKEDLYLTGVVSGFSTNPRALFMLTTPGKTPVYFDLHEGERNEWLEIRSVNAEQRTVTALLRKAIVRARGVGSEIVFSFDVHGVKPPGNSIAN